MDDEPNLSTGTYPKCQRMRGHATKQTERGRGRGISRQKQTRPRLLYVRRSGPSPCRCDPLGRPWPGEWSRKPGCVSPLAAESGASGMTPTSWWTRPTPKYPRDAGTIGTSALLFDVLMLLRAAVVGVRSNAGPRASPPSSTPGGSDVSLCQGAGSQHRGLSRRDGGVTAVDVDRAVAPRAPTPAEWWERLQVWRSSWIEGHPGATGLGDARLGGRLPDLVRVVRGGQDQDGVTVGIRAVLLRVPYPGRVGRVRHLLRDDP